MTRRVDATGARDREHAWVAWILPMALLVASVAYLVILATVAERFTFWVPEDWILFGKRADLTVPALFVPINGHWNTLPVLLSEAMLRLFGLWYPAYLLLVGVVHIAVVVLVFVLLRTEVKDWVAGLAAVLVLFLGSASEALFGFISIAFLLSLAFGLASLIVAANPEGGRARSAAIWLLLIASLASSGVGVVMVVVSVVSSRSWSRAVLAGSTLVAYGAWAILWPSTYGYEARGSAVEYGLNAIRVLAVGLVGRGILAPVIVGSVLLVALVELARGWRPPRLAIGAAVGLVVFYGAIGYRAGWEPSFAEPSRYLYPGVILGLIAVMPAFERMPLVGGVLLVVAIGFNVLLFPHAIDYWAAQSRVFRTEAAAVTAGRIRPGGKLEPNGPSAELYLETVARWGEP